MCSTASATFQNRELENYWLAKYVLINLYTKYLVQIGNLWCNHGINKFFAQNVSTSLLLGLGMYIEKSSKEGYETDKGTFALTISYYAQ